MERLPGCHEPISNILDSNLGTPAFRLLRDEDAHDLDGAPGHDPPAPPPRDGSGSGQLPHAWGAQFWPAQSSFAAVDLRDGQGRAPPPPPAQPAQHARHRRESARPGTRSVPRPAAWPGVVAKFFSLRCQLRSGRLRVLRTKTQLAQSTPHGRASRRRPPSPKVHLRSGISACRPRSTSAPSRGAAPSSRRL